MRERTSRPFLKVLIVSFAGFLLAGFGFAQASTPDRPAAAAPARRAKAPVAPQAAGTRRKACASCIRGHMEFLASDALRGRGSATHDELVAATYVAAQLLRTGSILRRWRVSAEGSAGTTEICSFLP
jgi:hypothetical protein